MLIYLAGPEVFLADAHELGARKKAICARFGFVGLFPLDDGEAPPAPPAETAHFIFDRCIDMMNRCDLGIANMTPWRGVSMDVGTAVEIGYLHGVGKPVFGYTNVAADYADRCPDDGCAIEAFGFHDNLMCEGPVWKAGGEVVRGDVGDPDLFHDLGAFEACVEQVRNRIGR
jgi:nucleoside 2-deoxyribosyltransferase